MMENLPGTYIRKGLRFVLKKKIQVTLALYPEYRMNQTSRQNLKAQLHTLDFNNTISELPFFAYGSNGFL